MATPALIALLNSINPANPLIQRDFYTITLADGTRLYYGGADFTISAANATIWNPPAADGSGGMWFAGVKWQPNRMVNASGQTAEWKLGLNANNWQLVFTPQAFNPYTGAAFPDTINGIPWLQAARSGYLEQADVVISTAYWCGRDNPLPAIKPIAGTSPVGTLTTFRGMVGAVDCSETAAYLTIQDYRYLAQRAMPRNQYQGSCRNRLYDNRCTLNAATFTKTGTAAVASTRAQIVANAAVAAPGGSATFALGTLTMTSGQNNGFARLVTSWSGGTTFGLMMPFPFDVAAGDTFSVTAGCDKSTTTCALFANTANFRGEPFIPIPEVVLG